MIALVSLATLLEGCTADNSAPTATVQAPRPRDATAVPTTNTTAAHDSTAKNFVEKIDLLGDSARSKSFDFSSDGRWLSFADSGDVGLWDLAILDGTGRHRALQTSQHVTALAFSPDSSSIAYGDDTGGIGFWDITRSETYTEVAIFDGAVHILAYSPDGQWLAATTNGCGCIDENVITIWDLKRERPTKDNGLQLRQHAHKVWAISFSTDSKVLATGDLGGQIYLWDMQALDKLPISVNGPSDGINGLAFSKQNTLAAAAPDGTVWMWDAEIPTETPQVLAAFPDAPKGTPGVIRTEFEVDSVTFSADGKTLAAGCGDGTVRLWQADAASKFSTSTNPTVLTLGKNQGGVGAVRFSPDGNMLGAEGHNGIRLWEAH
jgi:WD40 repeat protein